MERVLTVGLEQEETVELRQRIDTPLVAYEILPRIKIERGTLLVERHGAIGSFLPITRVVFHGIYEDDFDFITALALWKGPCLPDAVAMIDCRLRLPCLARSLRLTRFGAPARSYGDRNASLSFEAETVSKWGNWHCGENKETFRGQWKCAEPTLFEDFLEGQAVRVVIIGDRAWQIRLAGDNWKKSIHPDDATYMPLDPELLDDTRQLQRGLNLVVIGVDYIVSRDGSRHLLEVNHIPNVTRFPEIGRAYLDLVGSWLGAEPTPIA